MLHAAHSDAGDANSARGWTRSALPSRHVQTGDCPHPAAGSRLLLQLGGGDWVQLFPEGRIVQTDQLGECC